MNMLERHSGSALGLCVMLLCAGGLAPVAAQDDRERAEAVALKPATLAPHAAHAAQLAVARAGQRLVSVGDHGVVLLSDDEGHRWRQADRVPFDGLLTGVNFVDQHQGWAVGHAGVVLHTEDGGERWTLQRSDSRRDRPLFAVHFFDAQHGVAVGLWSLVLVTDDGGKTWQPQTLKPPEGARKADLNLLGLFVDPKGDLYASAEKGTVLRSSDRGRTWQYLPTGYAGSFWCGVALPGGELLVGGLRGSLFRSEDRGQTWRRVETGTTASITSLLVRGDQGVHGVGVDGLLLQSEDGGRSFNATRRDDRLSLTGLTSVAGQSLQLFSRVGPVSR